MCCTVPGYSAVNIGTAAHLAITERQHSIARHRVRFRTRAKVDMSQPIRTILVHSIHALVAGQATCAHLHPPPAIYMPQSHNQTKLAIPDYPIPPRSWNNEQLEVSRSGAPQAWRSRFPRLPVAYPSLESQLAYELDADTAGINRGRPCSMVSYHASNVRSSKVFGSLCTALRCALGCACSAAGDRPIAATARCVVHILYICGYL